MMGRVAAVEKAAVPLLPALHQTSIQLTLKPNRRGYITFKELLVLRPDPLNLFHAIQPLALSDRLLVLPKRYPVGDFEFSGGRRFQRGGVDLAVSVGDAEEFVALREYRPGDPLRHIHWKSMARLGKPVVKEYQDEYFVRHALLLDTFTRSVGSQRFESAVSVAASLACAPRSHEVLLDLMFAGTEMHCFTSGRGVSLLSGLLEVLACVEPNDDDDFTHIYPLLEHHMQTLSACICVFLYWDQARRELVQQLRHYRIQTLVVVLQSAGEEPLVELEEGVELIRMSHLAEDLSTLKASH